MKRILIIQAQMKQYRVPFFDGLHWALGKENLELKVAYSPPTNAETQKADNAELPPDYGIKVNGHWLCGDRVLYQPLLRKILESDLVIVEQANKHLLNHFLLLLSGLKLKRLAFWGLGENRQKDRSWVSEFYKRMVIARPDWWFAYTSRVAADVISRGVPSERVTAVQNAVDTTELRTHISSISDSDVERARGLLGIAPQDRVGVFCGSLDRVKGIPFLLAASRLIRERLPNFHLIIAGGGPDRALVEEMSRHEKWVHYVGPRFGAEKALFFKLSQAMLQPGRIGLVVLDAFAAGLPLLTIRLPFHGPEEGYLENYVNGMAIEQSVEKYSEAVVEILSDVRKLNQLKAGALRSSEQYTVEKMAERFKDGIIQCLGIQSRTVALSRAEAIQ